MDYSERLDTDTWQAQHELLSAPFWSAEDESYVAVTDLLTFFAPTADEAFWQWVDWYKAAKRFYLQNELIPC